MPARLRALRAPITLLPGLRAAYRGLRSDPNNRILAWRAGDRILIIGSDHAPTNRGTPITLLSVRYTPTSTALPDPTPSPRPPRPAPATPHASSPALQLHQASPRQPYPSPVRPPSPASVPRLPAQRTTPVLFKGPEGRPGARAARRCAARPCRKRVNRPRAASAARHCPRAMCRAGPARAVELRGARRAGACGGAGWLPEPAGTSGPEPKTGAAGRETHTEYLMRHEDRSRGPRAIGPWAAVGDGRSFARTNIEHAICDIRTCMRYWNMHAMLEHACACDIRGYHDAFISSGAR